MNRITKISADTFDHPLEEPVEISLGLQTIATNVLATAQTENGTVGNGESSPIPPVTGETQRFTLAIIREISDLFEETDLATFRQTSSELKAAFPSSPST